MNVRTYLELNKDEMLKMIPIDAEDIILKSATTLCNIYNPITVIKDFDDIDGLQDDINEIRVCFTKIREATNKQSLADLRVNICKSILNLMLLSHHTLELKCDNYTHLTPMVPNSYSDYIDVIETKFEELAEAILDLEGPQICSNKLTSLMAHITTLPEFSNFIIHYELMHLIKFICTLPKVEFSTALPKLITNSHYACTHDDAENKIIW